MRCHYEVLEVDKAATDDEIKKAYRKLALIWHPDKNPDKTDECTKYFPIIQQAYETLSDAQERAWYDRHRDQILKGGFDEHYKDNSLILFPYFSSSCYSGYGDDEKGFYAVYNHIFDVLIQEDADFEEDRTKIDSIPRFGDASSPYDTVVGPFYGHWQSYCTLKTYTWLDEHDIQQAPNRKILRLMEKDNKKIRDAAKKERNEEVRTLVEFVRKRDKRVATYRKLLEEQRKEQQAKVEAQRLSQKLKNLKAASDYTDATWHNVSNREDELQEIENHFDSDYEKSDRGTETNPENPENTVVYNEQNILDQNSGQDDDQLYCVACEKSFSNRKTFLNHQMSKKHRENLQLLKKHMHEDELKILGLGNRDIVVDKGQDGLVINKAKKKTRKARKLEKASTSSSDDENGYEKPMKNNETPMKAEKIRAESQNVEEPKIEDNNIQETEIIDDNVKMAPKVPQKPIESQCTSCKVHFESRTKLFAHLKETGHAALKFEPNSKLAGDKKKKTKKK